jgi:thymidylate synthase (FAD)
MTKLVTLVAVTQPRISNETIRSMMSPEQFIAYCARVSNPSNQSNLDTSAKLLAYCIRNQHWSIFEMVHVVMEINTTRDIARQILRHRSFSFQEFSQRYADASQLGFSVREARLQDKKNRQNSIETDDDKLKKIWNQKQEQLIHEAQLSYKWAIENGIAKEQARAILPEGNTNSRLYMSGTLRSWIHYCQLRMDKATQKEHREIADDCWSILCSQFSFLNELDKQ